MAFQAFEQACADGQNHHVRSFALRTNINLLIQPFCWKNAYGGPIGTTWNAAGKFILNAKVDGLFFWHLKGTSHYGRFTQLERPALMQHTWMSPNTLGQESTVTITFKKQGNETLMTLTHSDLPDHERARSHKDGWNYFLGTFHEQFGNGSRKKFDWDEAHKGRK